MKYQKIEIFPTRMLKVDVRDELTLDDRNLMVKLVDILYDQDQWDKNPLSPRFQTHAILFQESAPEVWQKLKKSFLEACEIYIKSVENFFEKPEQIKLLYSRAWCYKSNIDTVNKGNLPWHVHRSSFLSGIYYLQAPEDEANKMSTEFSDPLGLSMGHTRDVSLLNEIGCWTIFPGWLPHRAQQVETKEYRYTIAADCYAAQI